MNPVEMSKEMISSISHTYELATYSTPELRGLFNDWLGAIEREMLEFLAERSTVDPDEVAQHFRLERASAIFILTKLAREGKINIQASGS